MPLRDDAALRQLKRRDQVMSCRRLSAIRYLTAAAKMGPSWSLNDRYRDGRDFPEGWSRASDKGGVPQQKLCLILRTGVRRA